MLGDVDPHPAVLGDPEEVPGLGPEMAGEDDAVVALDDGVEQRIAGISGRAVGRGPGHEPSALDCFGMVHGAGLGQEPDHGGLGHPLREGRSERAVEDRRPDRGQPGAADAASRKAVAKAVRPSTAAARSGARSASL